MSQKRHPDDGKARPEGNSPEDKRRRVPSFRSVVLDVMRLHSVQHLLEPIIRKVVREEVEVALTKHWASMKQNDVIDPKEACSSELRNLQLIFINDISLPVFTGARIGGVGNSSLKVGLIDALTGNYVESGPESSIKVEIIALEGDFDSDNWTSEEFTNNIAREREGKKSLLTGDAFLNLKDGIGFVGEISFSDNSSWTRSRRFRLGAKVVDNTDGISVREAKTDSFIVRDHRGELYRKHHPPSLIDEVWRLEKIGKEGAFHKRLSRENINTVKDFLTLLFVDSPRLRNILGAGMSAKMWEATVEHARTCVLDKKMYVYHHRGSHQKRGVIFNIVGQVMGLVSDSQFLPIDNLSETEKTDAHSLVLSAFGNWGEVVSFDNEAISAGDISLPSSSHALEGSSGIKVSASHTDCEVDYTQPSPFSSDIISSICSVGAANSLEDYGLRGIDHTLSFPNQVDSLICDTEPLSETFFAEDHLQYFDFNFKTEATSQITVDSPAWQRAKIRWTKLFSILKWFSIRKIVTKRTRLRETKRFSPQQ